MAIKRDTQNARKHSDRNKQAIRKSLEAVGAGRSILLDADDNVLAGNGVLEQAEELGIPVKVVESDGRELLAVKRTDLTGDKARQAATLDNLAADTSAFDYDYKLLAEQLAHDPIADAIARDDKRIAAELDKVRPAIAETTDAGELIDKAQELQNKWQVQRGDLWQCGRHRILCGDSTNADDVARVMQGEKAQYCFTSPPYGIGLDYEKDDSLQELITLIIEVIRSIDSVIDAGYATMNYSDVFRKGDDGFTLMSGYYDEPFRKLGWWLRGNRVWFKPFGRLALSYATGTTMNLREWEYVQTWRKGNGQEKHHEHGLTIRGVWKTFGDDAIIPDWKKYDDTTEKTTHQAAFPVVLPIVGIRAYTDSGAIVYEPFLGSGTTLVACEQTGRIGRGIEIEPKYVAVTLERLSNLGLTCTRLTP